MRVLSFSDVHSSGKAMKKLAKKAEKADLVICAGDFTYFEEGMRKMLREMNSWKKQVLLVHGNHEAPENVRKLCREMKNVTFIHKKVHRIKDYAVVGHGGEGFALESSDFEKFAKKLRFKKGEKMIFVTHQPPHGTKLDFIWSSRGNKSYRKFIIQKKPVLAVCGHLHETAGMEDKLGKTKLINPGDKGMIVEL